MTKWINGRKFSIRQFGNLAILRYSRQHVIGYSQWLIFAVIGYLGLG